MVYCHYKIREISIRYTRITSISLLYFKHRQGEQRQGEWFLPSQHSVAICVQKDFRNITQRTGTREGVWWFLWWLEEVAPPWITQWLHLRLSYYSMSDDCPTSFYEVPNTSFNSSQLQLELCSMHTRGG